MALIILFEDRAVFLVHRIVYNKKWCCLEMNIDIQNQLRLTKEIGLIP